ncbi:hypothetical protein CAEBREN_14793 [Caenorhabditis brenneri]|uniref:F-box domain-containing protein n=1 Tax=Caenorhabditis brenneri TaxID=135651 RepID=G0MM80_CAEBE|nr:hypothetical protein CAEBREN_14793 [Caenorhabditis brenneri]
MAIKFNSFPYLIRKEIINQMCNQELIIFSFCSLKTQEFAMNHLTRKDVKAIRYLFSLSGLAIQMENKDENEEFVLMMGSSSRLNRRKLANIQIGEFQKPIEFEGPKGQFKDYGASLCCRTRHEKMMYQSVFDHLSQLFRRSFPSISVSLRSVRGFRKLIKVPGISHSNFSKAPVHAKMLDWHFKKYPNQISSFVSTEIKGEFSKNSAFLKVPTIVSRSSSPSGLFKHFKGRELRLTNYQIDTDDVIEFLEKKDRSKECDELVIDCRRYYQVKRASDQKIAAFGFDANSIQLCVFQ